MRGNVFYVCNSGRKNVIYSFLSQFYPFPPNYLPVLPDAVKMLRRFGKLDKVYLTTDPIILCMIYDMIFIYCNWFSPGGSCR